MDPNTLDLVSKELNLQTVAGREALKVALENIVLLDKKQQDYGSKNISDFGVFGVLVRLNDKVQRALNLERKELTANEKKTLNEARRFLSWCVKHESRITLFDTVGQLESSLEVLKKHFSNRRTRAANESIRDTFRDISNYGIIALLIDTKRWPTE